MAFTGLHNGPLLPPENFYMPTVVTNSHPDFFCMSTNTVFTTHNEHFYLNKKHLIAVIVDSVALVLTSFLIPTVLIHLTNGDSHPV